MLKEYLPRDFPFTLAVLEGLLFRLPFRLGFEGESFVASSCGGPGERTDLFLKFSGTVNGLSQSSDMRRAQRDPWCPQRPRAPVIGCIDITSPCSIQSVLPHDPLWLTILPVILVLCISSRCPRSQADSFCLHFVIRRMHTTQDV